MKLIFFFFFFNQSSPRLWKVHTRWVMGIWSTGLCTAQACGSDFPWETVRVQAPRAAGQLLWGSPGAARALPVPPLRTRWHATAPGLLQGTELQLQLLLPCCGFWVSHSYLAARCIPSMSESWGTHIKVFRWLLHAGSGRRGSHDRSASRTTWRAGEGKNEPAKSPPVSFVHKNQVKFGRESDKIMPEKM